MDQDIPTARVISDQSRLLTDGTDPWTYGAGYSVKPVARAIKIKHAGFNPCVLGSVRLMRHRDPETAQYECVAEAVSLVKGDRLSLVMTVTKAATSGKRVRPT